MNLYLRRIKSLNFEVRRQMAGTLNKQVVQGIQAAVQTGRFAAGQRLPTLCEMSAELGVSMKTMRCAIARLAAEGLLDVRRSTGIHVRSTHTPRFQGQILYVSYGVPVPYYYAARNRAFLEVLRGHDIHVTAVYVHGRETTLGFPTIRHILATQPVTLAVLDGEALAESHTLWKLLNKHGVRFVEKWTRTPSPDAVDSLFLDVAPAYQKLARHCARCGVKQVLFFPGTEEAWLSFRDAAQVVGVDAKQVAIPTVPPAKTGEVAVERSGHSVVAQLLKQKRIERGQTLLVATDDYFARGALIAILEAGWRIPRDIQLATLVNIGHIPVMRRSLTRIEMDPIRDGEAMAQVVLRNLVPHKRRRKPLIVCPRFVVGKSTRSQARSQ